MRTDPNAVSFLRLLAAQTLGAKDGASEPMAKLVDSFTGILIETNQLLKFASERADSPEISAHCEQIRKQCNEAIIHLQFADALTQKLEHVAFGLKCLGDTIQAPSTDNGKVWKNLEKQLLENYTSASEEAIHHTVFTNEPDS